WCKGKGMDAKKAFVLSKVSLDVTDETMYKVLDEAEVFGPCKIRGRCVEHFSKSQLVLVETINDMIKSDIPEQLLAGDEFGPWIVNVTETQRVHVTDERDFQSKLLSFLANKGKTLADVTGLLNSASAPPTAPDLNTKLVNAISSLVEKCQATPVDGPGYRKLRMFSGMKPTPYGEEEYDAWAEQTTHMLNEWQCSDVVKRQRIAESLKGPAADMVRGLRVANPQATANDYLKALETAFGTTNSAADLMVRLRNTFQQDGEKLSAYLLRLDKLLHAVYRKGGIEVIDMNRARIDQVARGSLPHDLVAFRIRLTYKLKPPPSFTELLWDVREEEE
ncbi:paraneoplastic antigen Ma1-like, partial [Silurus meridionalis]